MGEANVVREDVMDKVTLELGLKSIILVCSLCPLSPTSAEFIFILWLLTDVTSVVNHIATKKV